MPYHKNINESLPKGVMTALATPLGNDNKLDYHGLTRLLDHVLANKVSGICPIGSTGEGPLLRRDIRVEITAEVAKNVPNGTWNIPAVVATTLGDVLEDLDAYRKSGADAALVTTPFYYNLDHKAILNWFHEIIKHSPLPILLYNIPSLTKTSIDPEIVAELAHNDLVIGIKDSSRDLEYFENIIAATRNIPFSVFTGSDTLLLASSIIGGSGTIAASANIVPNLHNLILDSVNSQDFGTAVATQELLLAIVHSCRKPGFPAGWKAALSLMGICSSRTAFPILPATENQIKQLAETLISLGLPKVALANYALSNDGPA